MRAQIGVPSGQCANKNRIESGHPEASYLVDKIQGFASDNGCFAGMQMPRGASPLSPTEIALVKAWISAGTP